MNTIGLRGIEFIEFCSSATAPIENLFYELGFRAVGNIPGRDTTLYQQNDIRFILNAEPGSFARNFSNFHGPSIPSMGWKVDDAKRAVQVARERGAKVCEKGDYRYSNGEPVPAVYGIGDSLIYFIDDFENANRYANMAFAKIPATSSVQSPLGFLTIDHLTNNVPNGTMGEWAHFYKHVFGFTEVRYFDIKGKKTGLTSFALRSPDGSFCIPVNEAKEEKSQINEYLREYHGAGIQHIALTTANIVESLSHLTKTSVSMLSVEPDYYRSIFERVPNVKEDRKRIEELGILVDGDEEGYLLQIFTQNVVGPIFFEIIQRKNHLSFGEGNFGALFRSIEREQEKRGAL